MNSKIAVAVGLAAILSAGIVVPTTISTTMLAYAAEIAADVTQTPIQIIGGFLVPEFSIIAAILAGTIVAVIGFSRFSGSRTVFFGGA